MTYAEDTEIRFSTKEYQLSDEAKEPSFLTTNPNMLSLINKVKLIAKTKVTLLITGENGTGKEVLARLFHYHSNRSRQKMVSINCGAIASDLVESELFGHEKGAFTGAVSQKMGCFELANKGTLFLDEIGEMPLGSQVKLLRAVELESFRRVGGKEEIQVDVSLVSATNKILSDQVKSGSFREDLYYRLNVIELYIPPLRHRKDDIDLLINYYNKYFSEVYGLEKIDFDDECKDMFLAYDWPGNIRELKNLVERSVVLYEGKQITADQLPVSISKRDKPNAYNNVVSEDGRVKPMLHLPLGTSFEEIERQIIKQTLQLAGNNKSEAAKMLGLARKTLYNKIDKYHY